MASCARSGSWAAMASAISRWVSIVSLCRVFPVLSTKRGIELLITGISRGTTTFLLLRAMAAWNSISFCVWSSWLFSNTSTSSQRAVIFFMSFSSACVVAMTMASGIMATSRNLLDFAREAGRQSVRLAKMKNMKTSDIVTMDSFENAILVHEAI